MNETQIFLCDDKRLNFLKQKLNNSRYKILVTCDLKDFLFLCVLRVTREWKMRNMGEIHGCKWSRRKALHFYAIAGLVRNVLWICFKFV
jgi:hypothetical protein